MADLTLASANLGATPKPPMPPDPGRTILALDLGTTAGWALRSPQALVESNEWRSIPDWPAYEASSDGRIRRVRPSAGAVVTRLPICGGRRRLKTSVIAARMAPR
jgi:hypothetical protein